MSVRLACLFVLGGLPVAADTPIAQVVCAPRVQLEQRLAQQYRASLQASGLRDSDAVLEIWADGHGRWSLVQRWANGQSCIIAMGEDWTAIAPPA
jgi:hypothetical protein